MPHLIPAAEVSTRLGVNRSTVTRWVHSGRLKPEMKLPGPRGHYLFTAEEVARVEAQRADDSAA